ncbi:hypothetical protein ABTY20_21760 [Streptomyces sp. NPDC126497]|uniref:hypothetical protein n=1 Tax=Streptomyces sp. NPDC126497 TaxID=3155313 RepID=UPI0033263EEC
MTFTPGTDQAGAVLDPQSRADLLLPQGLKSAPRIPNPDHPHLGFNPVPGDTEAVRRLHKKLSGCAEVLQDAHDLVTKLLDGSYWKGDAAVAFREQLDGGPLPLNLKNAAHSIRKAARQLNRWEDELDEFQRRAKRLEGEAEEAQAAVDRAEGRAGKAAGERRDGAVEEAQAELDKVIRKAKQLAGEHERQAKHRASRIRDATKKLAPHEPGWFDEALDWLTDNLPDILSFVAGVVGVVAIIFAGPLGLTAVAALMFVASGLSVTALGLRLIANPETLESLKDGFSKGELDADFWSNLVSVGADAAGVIPGIGAVAAGAKGATNAIRAGGETLSFTQKAALFGANSMESMQSIAQLENPLVVRAVRSLSNPDAAAKAVAATSGLAGVGTGGFGIYNKIVDAEDDGIKDGAVAGVDGARLILDNAGIFDVARYAF